MLWGPDKRGDGGDAAAVGDEGARPSRAGQARDGVWEAGAVSAADFGAEIALLPLR